MNIQISPSRRWWLDDFSHISQASNQNSKSDFEFFDFEFEKYRQHHKKKPPSNLQYNPTGHAKIRSVKRNKLIANWYRYDDYFMIILYDR